MIKVLVIIGVCLENSNCACRSFQMPSAFRWPDSQQNHGEEWNDSNYDCVFGLFDCCIDTPSWLLDYAHVCVVCA